MPVTPKGADHLPDELTPSLQSANPPDALPDTVSLETNGVFRDYIHEAGTAKRHYDMSKVDVDEFENLLDKFNLPKTPVAIKRMTDMADYRLLWANENVIVETGANPFTGHTVRTNTRDKDPGYASFIRVKGDDSTVKALYEDLWECFIWSKSTAKDPLTYFEYDDEETE